MLYNGKKKMSLCQKKICIATLGMPYNTSLPVRLSEEIDHELSQIAARTGTSKSGLIRLLLTTFCEQVRGRSTISLPPDWIEKLEKADRRSYPESVGGDLQVAEGQGNIQVKQTFTSAVKGASKASKKGVKKAAKKTAVKKIPKKKGGK